MECRASDAVTYPMRQYHTALDALVEPPMIASDESSGKAVDTVVRWVKVIFPARSFPPSSVAPAVVSFISTSITALVEVAAPLSGEANRD